MSFTYFTRVLLATAILAIGTLSTQSNTASAVFGKKLLDQTGCSCCICPSCHHCCELESELVEEDRLCFDIEEKVICIPRVVFPWQQHKRSGCGCAEQPCSKCNHNGARTRKVCVIKASKYTCPKCEYTWSPAEKECKGGCGTAGCARPGCASAPCDAGQWNATPINADYETGANAQDYPWTASDLVVSDLPASHAVAEGAPPAPVAAQ